MSDKPEMAHPIETIPRAHRAWLESLASIYVEIVQAGDETIAVNELLYAFARAWAAGRSHEACSDDV